MYMYISAYIYTHAHIHAYINLIKFKAVFLLKTSSSHNPGYESIKLLLCFPSGKLKSVC